MWLSIKEGMLANRFSLSRRAPKHPAVDDNRRGGLFFQSGLLLVISLFTVLSFFSRRPERDDALFIPMDYVMQIEEIPETRVTQNIPPPPRMPVVPVPSDMEDMIEELNFEIETLEFVNLPDLPKAPGRLGSIGRSPRPLYDRFPEYPESERKKGHEGVIDVNIRINEKGIVTDVDVIRNTTRSKVLEKAAVEAAYKTTYQPALDKNNRPIAAWTLRTYTFGIKK